MLSEQQRHLRAVIGAKARHHPDADAEIIELRTEFRAAKAEEYIRKLVDEAPPLSDEQRARLAAILRPASHETAAAA